MPFSLNETPMSPGTKESLPFNVVEAHPPERGARPTQPVILYSCCCCCCCCLHTIGGVIGAAVAGARTNCRADDICAPGMDDSASPSSHLPSSQGLYWFSVLTAIVLSWIVATLTGLTPSQGNPLGSLFMIGIGLILIGPAWLLGGTVVMAIRLLFNEKLRQDGRYWRSLGLITVSGAGGTVAGLLLMFLIYVAMSGR